MNLGERIKKTRLSRGLTLNELAERIGKTEATIQRYESGNIKNLKNDTIEELANALNVSPAHLMGWDVRTEVIEFPKDIFTTHLTKLPLFGSIGAGALAVVDGVTQNDVEFLAMPRQFLGRYSDCTNLFAMVVNGESMNKVIKHGSIVVAKPIEIDQYKSGDIVIFSYNNEYSLKRFAPDELEGFVLFKSESDDPAFKDIPIPNSELSSLKLYGKIVYYGTTI